VSAPESRPSVHALTREALDTLGADLGLKPFQQRQLAAWVFEKALLDVQGASNLSKALRAQLSERVRFSTSELVTREDSSDGSTKLLLRLDDGEHIEMVLIPEGERTTLCMSSQVGCPVACIFCASGLGGVRRNLRSDEMVEQFARARAELGDERQLTNLVVMGLGEPMLNLDALIEALGRISDPEGMAFSPRRITVSTSGYPERIRDFAARGRGYEIAVSLHAAEPELRKELVPTAQHAPGALVGAAQDYHEKTGREPTFEVVLLEGRNDAERDAYAMVKLLRRVRCKVNIIPWNPVPELAGELHSPSEPRVARYQRILEEGGIKVTVRRHRGRDRDAACGQLRLRNQ
jgi:23S rRNA (adenine2503-C2)-methyltransferase